MFFRAFSAFSAFSARRGKHAENTENTRKTRGMGAEWLWWTQTKVSYILYKTNWGYPTTHNTLHTPHIGPYQAPFGASMPSGWFCMYRGYPKCHVSLPGTALSGPLRVFRVSPGLPSPGLSGPSPGLSGSQGAIRAPGETRRDPESTPPLRASRIRRWLTMVQ